MVFFITGQFMYYSPKKLKLSTKIITYQLLFICESCSNYSDQERNWPIVIYEILTFFTTFTSHHKLFLVWHCFINEIKGLTRVESIIKSKSRLEKKKKGEKMGLKVCYFWAFLAIGIVGLFDVDRLVRNICFYLFQLSSFQSPNFKCFNFYLSLFQRFLQ